MNRVRSAETTKKAIEAAALEVFSEDDFNKVTVRAIAERANVGLGTIYIYFPAKESILFSILESKANEAAAAIESNIDWGESIYNTIQKAVWHTCSFLQANIRFGMLIFNDIPLKSWRTDRVFRESSWNRLIIRIFEKGQAKGELRSDIDAIAMMDATHALVQRQFQMWVLREKSEKLTSVSNQLTEIIYSAFRKEAAR